MPWHYDQRTGFLYSPQGIRVAQCYSGHDIGRNNPSLQAVMTVGPIPRGMYTISDPFDSETHGPLVMRLTPDATNVMFGRSGFLIHGDSVSHPGAASLGCIVTGRSTREKIAADTDKRLVVDVGLKEAKRV